MTSSFRLIGGTETSSLFDRDIISNPLAGLMIGVIVTVVVQSSSTSTSIVVSMVAAGIVEVKPAIPIIMGANIGTSVTSTLVAFGQVADREKFKLSFAGATVHDMFNILSVLILLPIEIGTGYLRELTGAIVGNNTNTSEITDIKFLKEITDPLSSLIVQLDTKMLENIAINPLCCGDNPSLLKHNCTDKKNKTVIVDCGYIFEDADISDKGIGAIVLIMSLVCLVLCLIMLVKILSSIFKGSFSSYLEKSINSDFPGPFKYFTGYFFILIGCGLTILMQSSSVFTSALIPLVGVGVVKLERIFPLTLGSNMGTTVTGIIAALASASSAKEKFRYSLQIALCHTFFNLTGIIIWYPIPFFRALPLYLARKLGEISADYRWFALVYLIGLFFLVPLSIFGLSYAGVIVLWVVTTPILVLLLFIIIVNVLQTKMPRILPRILKNWNFLPLFLRSLEPYDRILRKTICRCKKFNQIKPNESQTDYLKMNDQKEVVKF